MKKRGGGESVPHREESEGSDCERLVAPADGLGVGVEELELLLCGVGDEVPGGGPGRWGGGMRVDLRLDRRSLFQKRRDSLTADILCEEQTRPSYGFVDKKPKIPTNVSQPRR